MANAGPETASSFLVVRLGAIGDCLRALPAVGQLRRQRPEAKIGWVVEDWVQGALTGCTAVDRFHTLNRGELRSGPRRALAEITRLTAELRAEGYEVALDLHGRLKSGVVTRLSGARWRIGYARKDTSEGNHLFTNLHVSLEDTWESRVSRFLRPLELIGIGADGAPIHEGLAPEAADLDTARDWYEAAGRPRLAVYPGTSAGRAGQRWPSNKWIALLARLMGEGVRAVVFWGPEEQRLAAEIADGSGAELAPPATLGQMTAMLGLFECYVGADTAALHMSWMQGVPCVFFSGPKPVRTIAPLEPVPWRALCASRYFVEGRRPGRQSKETVTEVSVEEALAAVRELLGTGRLEKDEQGR